MQDVELGGGAAGAVVLGFELAEACESFAAMLEPLGDLGSGDAELGRELGLATQLGVGVDVESGLQDFALRGSDAPLGRRRGWGGDGVGMRRRRGGRGRGRGRDGRERRGE